MWNCESCGCQCIAASLEACPLCKALRSPVEAEPVQVAPEPTPEADEPSEEI